ncbi:DUF2157 domain-containing protein [Alphaproteobacteria bacterium]|nr:DUF2157 domain-containing protein [Alphaproteobacteria bacterium]
MAIWNKTSVLNKAIEDWQERDLIDAATATKLTGDVTLNQKKRSFGSIIVLLGVVCLAFGAMTFVASNWEEMSRLARLITIFGSMVGAWSAAVVFKKREQEWLAQTCVLLACAIFGSGIMLIGQIYHIQGEPKDATWLWAVGTLIAALLTRSVSALSLAIVLFTVWAFIDFQIFGSKPLVELSFLIYWLICAAAAWWLKSRFSGHMVMLALGVWTIYISILEGFDGEPIVVFVVLAVLFIAVSLALFSDGWKSSFYGFERTALNYLFLTLGAMVLMWYVAAHEDSDWLSLPALVWPSLVAAAICGLLAALGHRLANSNRYDLLVTACFALTIALLAGPLNAVPFFKEVFMLALTIWAVRMGWRLEYRSLTVIGFIGFTAVMILIYFVTVGTLIGTSVFYLGAGVILLAGAVILPKVLKKKEESS